MLELSIRNPFMEYTVRQLRDLTIDGAKTTRAVDLLRHLKLGRVDECGRTDTPDRIV